VGVTVIIALGALADDFQAGYGAMLGFAAAEAMKKDVGDDNPLMKTFRWLCVIPGLAKSSGIYQLGK
jgi:hypothetical protein